MKGRFLLGTALLCILAALPGCQGSEPQGGPAVEKAFKGRDMPPEAKQQMQDAMAKAQQGAADAAAKAKAKAQSGG